MLDLGKYRDAVEKKIRFMEESNSASLVERDLYAHNVGHRRGLIDALEILEQTLREETQQEDEDDGNTPTDIS